MDKRTDLTGEFTLTAKAAVKLKAASMQGDGLCSEPRLPRVGLLGKRNKEE